MTMPLLEVSHNVRESEPSGRKRSHHEFSAEPGKVDTAEDAKNISPINIQEPANDCEHETRISLLTLYEIIIIISISAAMPILSIIIPCPVRSRRRHTRTRFKFTVNTIQSCFKTREIRNPHTAIGF
jgi:hypothetical protein